MPEQENSSHKKHEVGEPNPGRRREVSLFCEGHSDQRNRIVQKNQQNGQDKSAGLAAFLRGEAERNAHQGEDDASRRQRQAAMIFNQVPTARDRVGGLCHTEEIGKVDFTERCGFVLLTALGRGDLDGDVSSLKGGDLVLVRIPGIAFVSGTVGEVQVQSLGPLADEQAFARQADAWCGGVRQIGKKHAFPDGSAGHGLDVLHVQDDLRKPFVKHAGLDLERSLRRLERVLELSQSGERAGREVDAVTESEQPRHHHKD